MSHCKMSLYATVACLALAATAFAAVPGLISYQGVLTDDQGQPLDGSYPLTFRIYGGESGGTPLWTEDHQTVPVQQGVFNVILGGNPFPTTLFGASALWMGVSVGEDPELSPRMRITSVPWAMRAAVADTALSGGGGGADADWTIAGSSMYSGVSGNVGIGTTAPGRKLQVGNNSTPNAEGMIRLGSRSGTNGSNRLWDVGIPETDSDSGGIGYSFIVDDTQNDTEAEFMVKYGSGYVGIGTTTPSAQLDVVRPSAASGVPAARFQTNTLVGGTIPVATTVEIEGSAINAVGSLNVPTLSLNSTSSGSVRLAAGGGNVLLATGGGKVGVGTDSPTVALDVVGTAKVSVLQISGADLAEKFPLSEQGGPGTVMVIDPDRAGALRPSRSGYDTRVAGVVSGAGGLSVGAVLGECTPEPDAQPIAMSGRVWTLCDASGAAIEPGDLLTTADLPGHAMKAVDAKRSHGAILGKAMSHLERGESGLVLVLVNLQ